MINEVNSKDFRILRQNESFICLFSGGKDSAIALSMANQCGQPIAIIHSMEKDQTSYNHKQTKEIIELQAEAMGIPLELCIEEPKSTKFAYSLIKILKKYGLLHAKYLVTGTINDTRANEFNQKIAKIAGLSLKCPLWGMTNEMVVEQLEKRKIQSIISSINPNVLSKQWLGKQFDRNVYNEFIKLGIHPLGENGEFHTTLIGADFFKKELEYSYSFLDESNINMKLSINQYL